jgi:hypothetical protein
VGFWAAGRGGKELFVVGAKNIENRRCQSDRLSMILVVYQTLEGRKRIGMLDGKGWSKVVNETAAVGLPLPSSPPKGDLHNVAVPLDPESMAQSVRAVADALISLLEGVCILVRRLAEVK